MKICTFKTDKKKFSTCPKCMSLNELRIQEDAKNPETILADIKQLKDEREQLKTLIEKFDTLDDVKFLESLQTFYRWNSDEIVAQYGNKFLFNNTVEQNVKTDDLVCLQMSEGSGRDFSYWPEWYHVEYKIACDESLKLEDRVYTKAELNELCKANKIAVLSTCAHTYGEKVDESLAIKAKKQLDEIALSGFQLNDGFYGYKVVLTEDDIKEMCQENPKAVKLIREDITKEDLSRDYATLCQETKKQLALIKNELVDRKAKIQKDLDEKTKEAQKKLDEIKTLIEKNDSVYEA